jgi:hypothetical protein
MTEPLRLSYEIACAREHAFGVWTERIGSWWPRDHTVSGDPATMVVLEPRDGGRIYERTTDGDEIDWGEITEWDAPRRLAYLWHLGRNRSDATDVVIDFVELESGGTRVDITHTGWERVGAHAESWRDANVGGWNGLVPHFLEACLASTGESP